MIHKENDLFLLEQGMPKTLVSNAATLGEALRKRRKAMKITQEVLSLQTGISKPTIRSIEKGKETAHLGLVLQLCNDLGVTLTFETSDSADRAGA